jgi:hypothetical protein
MKKIMIFLMLFSFIFISSVCARVPTPKMKPIKSAEIYIMIFNDAIPETTSDFNIDKCNLYIKNRLGNQFIEDGLSKTYIHIEGRRFVEVIQLYTDNKLSYEQIKNIMIQVYRYFEEYYSYSVYKEIR